MVPSNNVHTAPSSCAMGPKKSPEKVPVAALLKAVTPPGAEVAVDAPENALAAVEMVP